MTKVQITLRRASSIIFVQFLFFLKNLSIAKMKSQVEIPGKKLMTRLKTVTREKYPRLAKYTRDPRLKPATREQNPRLATRDN